MCRNKRLLVVSLVLSLLVLAAAVMPVYANDLDQKRQEQAELEQRLAQERNNLQQQRNRETSLKQELDQLDRRLQALRNEVRRLAGEISRTDQEIAVAEAELAEAEEQLAYQESLFKRRLRAIYEQGYVTYLEVLLDSTTFADFLTRFNNLKIIASNDLHLVEEIQAERDRIQLMKDELEEKKNQLEGMRRQTLANEAEVERTVATRERILVELREEIARNLKAIQDLEQEAQELDRIIRQLIGNSGGGISGTLRWPIEAPYAVTSGFGWRRDPFTGASAWHGAIDIAPYYGAANYILAAEYGRVIFAGWNGGYGNCIMVDHGGGTVTLYAHMSSLLVGVGDTVSRGERIARAGTTGYSTGVHLHFEVREYNKPPYRYYPNGQPDYRYNPMSYF